MAGYASLARGFLLAAALVIAALPAPAAGQVLVVVPHPDDDVVIAAGVVWRAHARGEQVRIVYVTNGDRQGVSVGLRRQGEAVSGQAALGTPEDNLIFLGYPNGGLVALREQFNTPEAGYVSPTGVAATYGTRGLGRADYHTYRWGLPAPYNWPALVGDLADLVEMFRPHHIFTVSRLELHEDHAVTSEALAEALGRVVAGDPGYRAAIHTTFVWPGDSNNWPNAVDPTELFAPTPNLDPGKGLVWEARESLDVPRVMQSWALSFNPKALAMAAHASQGGVGYLEDYLHKDEFFWVCPVGSSLAPPVPRAGSDQLVAPGACVTLDGSSSTGGGGGLRFEWRQVEGPAVALLDAAAPRPTFTAPNTDAVLAFELVVADGEAVSVPDAVVVVVQSNLPPVNIAPTATVSASSEVSATQAAVKAVDGVVSGYPVDRAREWVTSGERAGAWIDLRWAEPHRVDRVVLHDRPLLNNQVARGTLGFSDGSSIAVGPLENAGRATEFVFPPREVWWVRFTVDAVGAGTSAVGLAEMQVFEAAPGTSPEPEPEDPGTTPYGGVPWPVPGTIQAEDFDEGGEAVAYHDESASNSGGGYRKTGVDIQRTTDVGGGFNVGWMTAGEWLAYTVRVASSGTYVLRIRVAAAGAGGRFHVEAGGRDVSGPLVIPNTGSWQRWTTVEAPLILSRGIQVLRLVLDANGPTGVFGNVNWWSVETSR